MAAGPKRGGPHAITWSSLTALRLNPVGLQELFDVGYTYRLSDSDSVLLQDTFVGLSFSPILTPAFLNPGVTLKVQPLAILRVDARVSWVGYLGSVNLLQSFPSPTADHSDSTIKARGEQGLNYSTTGWNASVAGELRGKVGPLVARSRLTAVYHDMKLEGADRVWYDQYYDLLVAKQGWTLTNDLDVLWQLPLDVESGSMLMAGLRWSLATPLYRAEDFAPGEAQENVNGPYHRLGPMLVYTFFDEPGATFNRPSIIALVNWHLAHRWRTGADVAQGIPYVAIAFAFTGDLWRSAP